MVDRPLKWLDSSSLQEFALATHKGTLNINYAESLKNSEYEFSPSAEIEWYDNRFIFASPDSEFDIYISVK